MARSPTRPAVLVAALAALPLLGATYEHRLSVGAGGGEVVATGCGYSVRRDVAEVGLAYQLDVVFNERWRLLVGARGGAFLPETTTRDCTCDDEECERVCGAEGRRGVLSLGADVGVWHRWFGLSAGIVAFPWDNDGVTWPPLFASGSIRLFPEEYVYARLAIFPMDPLVVVPGELRLTAGTRAWDPLHVELGLGGNLLSADDFGVLAALSLRLVADLRPRGMVRVSAPADSDRSVTGGAALEYGF